MKTILNTKPFQETLNKGMCGPACLKIVLSFYNIEKSEDEILKTMEDEEKQNMDDMKYLQILSYKFNK